MLVPQMFASIFSTDPELVRYTAWAMRVWDQPGFDAVNVSSNKNYSVRELYATACELMGKQIEAKYLSLIHI